MEKPGSCQVNSNSCCSAGIKMRFMVKSSSVQMARHLCGQKWFVTFGILLLMCLYVNVNGENVGGGQRVGLNTLRIPQQPRMPRETGRGQDQNETWIIGKVANQNICRSVDIRNNMVGWQPRALAECDIIEGSLRLIVINQNQTHDGINNISFPRLKQVTDYILFYRVFGLKTFTLMFPNLAVIRGHRLFHEYALVVFENLQLSSVGLIGLRRVLRGTVRFEKNTQLCFLDTVDWQHITNRTDHIIQDNSDNSDNANEPACKSRGCSSHCSNFTSVQGLRPACWNDKHCQLLHQPLHCHPYCEGGCSSANSARHCTACKQVNFDGTCMASCPRDTYLFEGWRCIRREECNITQPGRPESEKYKAFNGSCIYECPVGYTPTQNKSSCIKCDNECPKTCAGRMIDSAARAQAFKGCTKIEGALRIQVSGENIVKELEENLADVREIDHYLRVSYSAPLVSLTFLSNLRVIHGEKLVSDQYALYFLHNHNLLTLWPDSTNLTIVNGRAFFHFNHKLCLSVIHNLLNRTGLQKEDAIDIGELTNGDKVPCERMEMTAWIIMVSDRVAVIGWKNFRHQVKDFRTLLGYNVFYREAPEKNVSLFSGRDACGGDAWNAVDYISTHKENETVVRQMVRDLKPYTQYAFYVETLMSKPGNSEPTGQSKIQYFMSAPAVPTVPRNLKVYPLEKALRVEWDPPAESNGIITHYYLVARYTPETLDHNHAFCKDPGDVVRPPPLPPVAPPAFNSSMRLPADSCECSAEGDGARRPGQGGSASSIDRANKEEQNWFEDLIQNTVFRKKDAVGRGRRSINTTISNELPEPLPLPPPELGPCVLRHSDGWCKAYEVDLPANVTSKNSTILRDLHYFAEYTVEVYACQHLQSCRNESLKGFRSPAAIASRKTLKNDTADALAVQPVISNQTTAGQVMLTWVDPPLPNGGHVLSYIIHIRRVDGDVEELSSKRDKCPADRCDAPPCRQEQQLLLAAGNNSIQVQARTLAGLGPLSPPLFYLVADAQSHLSSGEVIAIVIGVLLVVTTLGVLAICYRRNTKPPMDAIYTSWNPYYGGQMIAYQPDEWEVAMEKVYFDRVVGTGSFGSVYEGTALLKSREPDDDTEQLYRVAIKTLLEDANMYERQAFLAEASLMKEFRCHHVVRLMGIVSNMSAKTADHIPRAPFVIMELMAKGDLKSYLRSMRPEEEDNHVPENYPVLPHIYKMAIQIADGMAYLAQMNSVHRDLAARNCLVSEDITIKIGDFGMTRHLYDKNYYRKDGKGFLPVRWMGPESLLDGRFTSQSDVWSFGVVLWEMATYGAQPYQGLSNEEVMKHVTSRNRMSRPETCPQRLYDIMLQCWQYRPTERPSFVQLVEELLPLVDATFANSSFYHTQRRQMLEEAAAAAERAEEPEPTVLTPLTAASCDAMGGAGAGGVAGAGGGGGTVARHARMAEAEDLTDEEECDLELRPIAPVRPMQRADPEANYAEFEAMKLEGRNGGHGSLSSAENSKAHSLQFSSSDGSKDSKASNGSARNGYIASGGALSLARTAEC